MSSNIKEKIKDLPAVPGVYYFYGKNGKLLYIGKAASLKSRVSSYFQKTIHDNKTQALVEAIEDMKYRKTDSVLEALILEANEIKKYLPPYNIRAKDDKTFVNIVITKEEFPRVLVSRPTEDLKVEIKKTYGPYTSAKSARNALKILRKIFPFHARSEHSEKKCLDFHLGLCPGPYNGLISKKDYSKIIKRIEMVLSGKKKNVLSNLEKEMRRLSKEKKFEDAAAVRDKIFALKHIQDTALLASSEMTFFERQSGIYEEEKIENNLEIAKKIQNSNSRNFKRDIGTNNSFYRIEAYDISNISGKFAVGSMVVFEDGEIAKDEYRKFKIRTIKEANDIAMLGEVLGRRFKHNEWKLPDLILMDGGKAQVNAAQSVLDEFKLDIPVIGVAKGPTRKNLDFYFPDKKVDSKNMEKKINKKIIAHIMSEAHRFAITYHRLLRKKGSLD